MLTLLQRKSLWKIFFRVSQGASSLQSTDFSKRAQRRSSASEALKPLKDLAHVLEEKLQNLESSLADIKQNLDVSGDPWCRLSRPRNKIIPLIMNQEQKGSQGKPIFNRFARARHTGASPFRSNLNIPSIGTRESRTRSGSGQNSTYSSTSSLASSVVSNRSERPLNNIIENKQPNQPRSTGAIPKKNLQTNAGKENRQQTVGNSPANRIGKKPSTPVYTFLPEPENGPTFHRNRLLEETNRLVALADRWEALKTMAELNEDIIGEISCVTNGIRLLVKSKFKQFRDLVEDCSKSFRIRSRIPVANYVSPNGSNGSPKVANGTPSASRPLIRPDDLDGFWCMMALQVESIDKKVERLELLKSNNWIMPGSECAPVDKDEVVARPVQLKPARKAADSAKSNFRQFLLKKKAMTTQIESPDIVTVIVPEPKPPNPSSLLSSPIREPVQNGDSFNDSVIAQFQCMTINDFTSGSPAKIETSPTMTTVNQNIQGTPAIDKNHDFLDLVAVTPSNVGTTPMQSTPWIMSAGIDLLAATPSNTAVTPMPSTPWNISADTDVYTLDNDSSSSYTGVNVSRSCGTSQISNTNVIVSDDSSQYATPLRYTNTNEVQDTLLPLENSTIRPPRSAMSMSLTPRVLHNIEKARSSRRSSMSIIVQQSYNGRIVGDFPSPIESNSSLTSISPTE